jgi:hypothetical protein
MPDQPTDSALPGEIARSSICSPAPGSLGAPRRATRKSAPKSSRLYWTQTPGRTATRVKKQAETAERI